MDLHSDDEYYNDEEMPIPVNSTEDVPIGMMEPKKTFILYRPIYFLRSVKWTTWLRWILILLLAAIIFIMVVVFRRELILGGYGCKHAQIHRVFWNASIDSYNPESEGIFSPVNSTVRINDVVRFMNSTMEYTVVRVNGSGVVWEGDGAFKVTVYPRNWRDLEVVDKWTPKKNELPPFDLHFANIHHGKLLGMGMFHVLEKDCKKSAIEYALNFIDGIPIYFGAPIMVFLYAFACIFFLPGLILTLSSGFLFQWWGLPIVSAGSVLGATICFLLGRTLLRKVISRQIEKYPRFRAIDRAIEHEGWKVIFLLRLIPLIPFNILNYALGLTSASLIQYIITSFVGMLPMTTVYVYFGIAAKGATGGIAAIVQGKVNPANLGLQIGLWVATGLGIIAVVVVIIFIGKRAMKKYMVEENGEYEEISDAL